MKVIAAGRVIAYAVEHYDGYTKANGAQIPAGTSHVLWLLSDDGSEPTGFKLGRSAVAEWQSQQGAEGDHVEVGIPIRQDGFRQVLGFAESVKVQS